MADATQQRQVVPFEVVVQVGQPTSNHHGQIFIPSKPGVSGFVSALESALVTYYDLPGWQHLIRWAVVKSVTETSFLVEGAVYT